MIITLTGKNEFMVKSELTKIIDDFVNEYGEMAVERLDAEDVEYDFLIDAVSSAPFLVEKKLTVLAQPSLLPEITDNFDNLVDRMADTTTLVFYEPKLDKRKPLAKLLKTKTDYREFSELKEYDLSSWIIKTASDLGGKISKSDAAYLIDQIGSNQNLLKREVEKLVNYSLLVTRGNIDKICEPVPKQTVFNLIDMAFSGNTKRALEIYTELRQSRIDTTVIIAMLTWQLHVLAILKTAGDKDLSDIAKESGISPYSLQKSRKIAAKMPNDKLLNLISDLSTIDVRSKSTADDTDGALKLLITTI